jgi:hypothetical protein
LENLLNLALDSSNAERDKSLILDAGYDGDIKSWELIVKFNGDLEKLSSQFIKVEKLIGGYAIVTIREDLIKAFASLDEVEFVEMPKMLFFE